MHNIQYRLIAAILVAILLFGSASGIKTIGDDFAVDISQKAKAPFGDRILVCTSKGLRYISLVDFNQNNFPQEKKYQRPHCLFCILQSTLAYALIPTGVAINIGNKIVIANLPTTITTHITRSDAIGSLYLRAPPNYFSS